ncbi:MAG: hypothetical protein AB7D03_03755 [Thiomicrospira sp.]
MNLLLNLLKETLLAMLLKIGWRVVIERFITRAVIGGLRKLASMTTNTLATETVEDIVVQLQGKKLKIADETPVTLPTPQPAKPQPPTKPDDHDDDDWGW